MAGITILFESAVGYALFDIVEADQIAITEVGVQEAVKQLDKFGRICKLKAFVPFRSTEDALDNLNKVSEGIVTDLLKNFLETNVPKPKSVKKADFILGVADHKIGGAIQETLSLPCSHTGVVVELLRGIRFHFGKLIKALKEESLEKAQKGLGHSYSRGKVKFNVHRVDNMIIQASCLLDQLDKDINTFAMRVREWYSYHFPELFTIVRENSVYARLAAFIGRRDTLSEASIPELEKILMDSNKAAQIIEAAKRSMGMDISDIDLVNIEHFAKRVVSLSEYRQSLSEYLHSKMQSVAPNLSQLVGDQVGARLISKAGSLTNLAKYPASTVQILGAEKALFRALKTRGNTPKYGLIYNSSFISRAESKYKGRISRYLANKCSIASRIDCFSDAVTDKFGEEMHKQVDERLTFFSTGEAPRKNVDVMHKVMKEVSDVPLGQKRKSDVSASTPVSEKKKKKKSKEQEEEAEEPPVKKMEIEPTTPSSEKKKKKKSKSKDQEDD